MASTSSATVAAMGTAMASSSSSSAPLRSEDTDSIMTDEVDEGTDVEEGGGVEVDVEGDEQPDGTAMATTATAGSGSRVARPTAMDAPPPSSSPPPPTSSSAAAATPTSPGSASPPASLLAPKHHHHHHHHHPHSASPSASQHFRPLVAVCEFGDRLGYTYFGKPLPAADALNAAYRHTDTHWFTVDHDLTYLSFFRDTGPLNVGCLYRFCLHLHELLEVRDGGGGITRACDASLHECTQLIPLAPRQAGTRAQAEACNPLLFRRARQEGQRRPVDDSLCCKLGDVAHSEASSESRARPGQTAKASSRTCR